VGHVPRHVPRVKIIFMTDPRLWNSKLEAEYFPVAKLMNPGVVTNMAIPM
jgi:hypothetical protein